MEGEINFKGVNFIFLFIASEKKKGCKFSFRKGIFISLILVLFLKFSISFSSPVI